MSELDPHGAGAARVVLVEGLQHSRGQDHADVTESGGGLDVAAQIEAGARGQEHVGQDHVGVDIGQPPERGLPGSACLAGAAVAASGSITR
jgi:hypothetical protein